MDPESLKAAGWMAMEVGGFSGQIAPIWTRKGDAGGVIGFLAEPRHGNTHLGTVHGGALMTFADIALGYGAADVLGNLRCATAQLQLQFVASPQVGDFITCRPEIVRRTTHLIFVRGLIDAGDKTVASADGIWKVLEQRPR